METLPQLISDLAYILAIAGIVTIVFKRLKQPLVLGYIVAGFLAGPHMPYTPSVADNGSIEDWSQIGVIFLMFTLGLEFSFKKIVKMGVRPILAALCVMVCFISVVSTVGYLFGWNDMDRLFLGGMLAMSSTTIIYKAYDDLGLRSEKFASGVLSVLILEDILGILLMVILSALAVSQRLEGSELLRSLLQLGFFLLLWFMVGVYMVPLFLRKYRNYINSETLLIVSVGLCFLMVVIAHGVGYSPAFGAFMMGSILSETAEAESIEKTVSSVKDLFGAIFFVSVGMLVDPAILLQYWLPVLVITLAVIGGQMLFGTTSFLITGNTLKESIQSGFSLVQIGEFAFIIAALGETLHVTSFFLYPVVVAVSIVTTFFTPYIIRWAVPVYKRIEKLLPDRVTNRLDARGKEKKKTATNVVTIKEAWKNFMKGILMQTVAYLNICIAATLLSFSIILPVLRQLLTYWPGTIVCGVLTLVVISPCIRPIVMRKNNSAESIFIRRYSKTHNTLFWLFILLKLIIGCAIVYHILKFLSPLWWPWHILASFTIVMLIITNKRIKLWSIKIERTFKHNLTVREQQQTLGYGRKLRGKDLQIFTITVPMRSKWGGKSLAQLQLGRTDHIHIAAIVRGNQRINIPGGNSTIFPGDTIEVVGDESGVQALKNRMGQEIWLPQEHKAMQGKLSIIHISISESSPLVGKTIVDADFRNRYHCMVVGIDEGDGNLREVRAHRKFAMTDTIWVVGEESDLSMLTMAI